MNISLPVPPADLPFREAVNPAPMLEHYTLRDDGTFPNNARLPLMLYRSAIGRPTSSDNPAAILEQIFAYYDWRGSWRNGIYSFHHYHSTSHEVLGIYRGEASVRLGGPSAGAVTVTLHAGDIVIIPAGVGHCNLGSSADFGVVGAYPEGRRWDICRGQPGDRPGADERIAALPLPGNDPLGGPGGPMVRLCRDGRLE